MVIVWYIVYSPFSQLEWPIIMTKQLLIICEWCSHRLIRSIRVWSWLENLKRAWSVDYEAVWLFLLQCAVVAKPKFVAKAWINPECVVKAWIKHIVVAKTTIKHEVVAKASIYTAFGYEKNNPARRAGEKNNLAPILAKKNFRPRHRSQAPQNIKWTVPYKLFCF